MKRKMKYIRKMTMAALVAFSVVACNYTKPDEPNNGEGGNQNPMNRTTAEEVTMGGNGVGYYNGHEYVDLGLPSGTLWATCNVGADTPEEYGDYFAWGETQPKDHYLWSNYKYCRGEYDQFTKYCTRSDYGFNGFTDGLKTLQPMDDAARANWGGDWRMPTKAEWEELFNNTFFGDVANPNGVYGIVFYGNNGASLFMPAAGDSYNCNKGNEDSSGNYWSSSLYMGVPAMLTKPAPIYCAWYFRFALKRTIAVHCYNYHMSVDGRGIGFNVRAVRSARQN